MISHTGKNCNDIHHSGTYLLGVINDILDMSKIEAGHFKLELDAVDIPSIVQGAVRLVRDRAGKKGVIVAIDMDKDLPNARADVRAVRQILLNLLILQKLHGTF